MRAIVLLAALAAAVTARAAEEPAESAAPAAPAAPAVEVVREGDGGLADAWRDEGAEFATYGPDGEAVVPTVERQALQALANAYDVQFVRLLAPDEDVPGVLDICTTTSDCLAERPVIARVAGDTIAKYALAREVAAEWLDGARPGPADGTPAWTHALAYTSDGHAWEVLVSYDGGRYRLRRDGADIGDGATGGSTRRAAFDALMASPAS